MNKYKIVNGAEYIRSIFEGLRKNLAVRFSYLRQTVLNIHNSNSGLVYDVGNKEIMVWGKESSALLKVFNEKIKNDKKIKLEEIK